MNRPLTNLFKNNIYPIKKGIAAIKEERCYIAMRDTIDPIGYCIISNGTIDSLGIYQDYRGLGIAEELLKCASFDYPSVLNQDIEQQYKLYDRFIQD